MSQRNRNIIPGWKMTLNQRAAYWRMFADVAEAKGWTGNGDQMSAHRREFHVLAGLGPISAKAIDHLKMFDAIKACHLAITQPGNLNAQMRMENQPRHRLITRIKSMAPEGYWRAIMRDKFHSQELEDLTETELTQLRNTIEARLQEKKHNSSRNGRRTFCLPDAAALVLAGVENDNVPF